MLEFITKFIPDIAFSYTRILWLIPVAFIVLMLLLFRDFVHIKDKYLVMNLDKKKLRRKRTLIFISRFIIMSLLIIALSRPFVTIEHEVKGDPKLVVFVDNSTSMGIFSDQVVPKLMAALKAKIPVESYLVANDLKSDIGDNVLSHLERNSNYLLISDGRVNYGSSLTDVALFAASLNSSISVLNLEPIHKDIGLVLTGPSKTVEDADSVFTVHANRVQVGQYDLKVTINGEEVLNGKYDQDTVTFTRKFKKGTYVIEAKTIYGDFMRPNDISYKVVNVVEKPNILLLTTKSTPLQAALEDLYLVTTTPTLPSDLSKYLAVVVEDMPARDLDKYTSQLQDYLIDGNGMLVIGGLNSFDKGGYSGSRFSSLLPVKIGTGKEIEGDANVVVLIDMSPSTTNPYDLRGVTYDRVEKAFAADVIESSLKSSTNVAVYSFDNFPHPVSELSTIGPKRADVAEKIRKLVGVGTGTIFYSSISTAANLLESQPGSKDIILISDGHDSFQSEPEVRKLYLTMRTKGIKVHSIDVCREEGVGSVSSCNHDYMKEISYNTNGKYYNLNNYQKLLILFSKGNEKDQNAAKGNRPLVVIDDYHFITQDLGLNVTMYGFNDVVPKSNGDLLVAMDTGQPSLTVWNYGLGRVAALTTFSQGNNLGPLLAKDQSALFTRTLNWVISDPERNNPFYINVPDTYTDGKGTVFVKSSDFPVSDELVFYKTQDQNLYEASFIPGQQGINEVYGKKYAVNYASEYQSLDQDENLYTIAKETGGKVFQEYQPDEIIDFVKTHSSRQITEKVDVTLPLLLTALLLYLIEICARRIAQNLKKDD